MKNTTEFETFNAAMDTLLSADPKAVKEAMNAEIKTHEQERKAKGQRKRGRKPKPPSVSAPASSAKD